MTTKKKDFINILNKIEPLFNETGFNYKIKISHPAIEHIFEKEIKNNKILNKTLKNNFKFYFKLDSRITKDFFISSAKHPDHVNEPQTTKLLTKILSYDGTVASAFPAKKYINDTKTHIAWVDVHDAIVLAFL